MDKKIALITDTVANLPQSYIDKHNIYCISLYIVIDEVFHKDGVDITAIDIAEKNEENPKFAAKSSAPSPSDFSELFKRVKEDGYDEAIFIGIGSQLSSSINNAAQADKHGLDLRIIDSKTIIIVEGLLVMYAKDLIAEGLSLDEIENKLNMHVGKALCYGWVDTLKYLKAGGRLGRAATKVSTTLNLKPLLTIDGGGNFNFLKLKCSKEKSKTEMAKRVRQDLEGAENYYLAYAYGVDPAMIEGLKADLADIENGARDSYDAQFTSVIAVHAGHYAYCLAYLKVDD